MRARKSLSSTAAMLPPTSSQEHSDWRRDRGSLLLLICLYTAQGLPMGLAFGSIPFLLKEHGSSYADLAYFSLVSLPYSVKLIIAPIVDSIYHPTFGRRKSWIAPSQFIIGLVCFAFSTPIAEWVRQGNVSRLTPTFILLLALTATQDIAVDGWSLTLLSRRNVAYASTCQSLGLSIGYLSTFTILLALSNPAFSNSYVRAVLPFPGDGALLDLAGALRGAGVFYLALTLYITFMKPEAPAKKSDDDVEAARGSSLPGSSTTLRKLANTYADLLGVLRKPAVQTLICSLLVAKVGFSAHDNVAPLKLLERGFSKESMASLAVLQAPFTLVGTVIAGRLAAKYSPVRVYLSGFLLRFAISLTGPPVVFALKGAVSNGFYGVVLVLGVMYAVASDCLMFVGIGAMFLNVSATSVHVAGSYLTMLNTAANMGGLWHRAAVLWLVDKLTTPTRDGYLVIAAALVPVGATVGVFLIRTLPKLEKLPMAAWRGAK